MSNALLWTPLLLIGSNVLMTFAWYGHLKQPSWPLWLAILVSWGIAFLEYCLAVPANRIGYGTFTGQQLKVMQEVITLFVFAGFSVAVLGEPLRWNYFAAMLCLVAAVGFIFLKVE
ncbi:DMT family protein [Roseomonas sp. SSH11]|uniref:DMT family protein n=1 Tax=Pararoseomonas baculiformis TaxID=2820812 RepID=A0ABS4AJG5_9PROT|nr:DMT family protein [Pararoseomonas baculiformis]MBP0446364.1 DMT family protein [Pararoseomonas baculiformis]